MKGFLKRSIFPLLVILLSFWTIRPLMQPGFFPMHDDTQPARVFEMAKALSFGQFPVRWVGDLGYGFGYPLFNFYGPLPYYIGAIFNLSGFDPITATKIMFGIGLLLAGISMYLFLKNIVGVWGAFVGGILYAYAPYHAVDIYVRGAVGEFYAMVFLPILALGIYKILSVKLKPKKSKHALVGLINTLKASKEIKSGILLTVSGFAGILLSHNILGMVTAEVAGLLLLFYFLFQIIKKENLTKSYFLLLVLIIGIGLSSFFIFPAVLEKSFTRVDELTSGSNNFTNHFVYLDQFWNSPWGYAGSAPGRADGMSFMMGKLHLLLGVLSIWMIFYFSKRKKVNRLSLVTYYSSLVIFFLSIFFMINLSRNVWELIPGFPFIQYPWRFLVYSSFALSVMVSMIFIFFGKKTSVIFALIIVFFAVWYNSRYFVPQKYLPVTSQEYVDGAALRFKISKISDEYMPKDFSPPKSIGDVAWQGISDNAGLHVEEFAETPVKKIYKISADSPNLLQTKIAYFPGWHAAIDGKPVGVTENMGVLQLPVPAGKHELKFTLEDTPARFLSNTISILAVFLVGYIILL